MLEGTKDGTQVRALVVVLCTAAGAGVVLAAFAPAEWLAVKSPTLGAAADTAAGLGALFVCWVMVLRAERTRALGDVAFAGAIGVLTIGSMLLAALTHLVEVDPAAVATWVPVPGRLAAGVLLVAAGRLGPSRMRAPLRRPILVGAIVALGLALAGVGAGIGALGAGADVPLFLDLLTVALLLGGAGAIFRRGVRAGDPALPRWAGAVVLLAVARAIWALGGVPDARWSTAGDAVLLAAVALLVLGSRSELAEAGRAKIEDALDRERHRLAREIHDGLAQELAFIVSQSRRLAQRAPNEAALDLLARAGETAMTDARRAIFTLTRPRPSALSTAVVERAFLKAERAGLALEVEVLDEVRVAPEVEHAILRIIDEAVSNAARHAAATSISIRISSEEERVVVRIIDDGRGFDARARRPRRRLGLTGMTERAESLGGELRLESQPGQGTMIEVAI